jgi:hypothetical protein
VHLAHEEGGRVALTLARLDVEPVDEVVRERQAQRGRALLQRLEHRGAEGPAPDLLPRGVAEIAGLQCEQRGDREQRDGPPHAPWTLEAPGPGSERREHEEHGREQHRGEARERGKADRRSERPRVPPAAGAREDPERVERARERQAGRHVEGRESGMRQGLARERIEAEREQSTRRAVETPGEAPHHDPEQAREQCDDHARGEEHALVARRVLPHERLAHDPLIARGDRAGVGRLGAGKQRRGAARRLDQWRVHGRDAEVAARHHHHASRQVEVLVERDRIAAGRPQREPEVEREQRGNPSRLVAWTPRANRSVGRRARGARSGARSVRAPRAHRLGLRRLAPG